MKFKYPIAERKKIIEWCACANEALFFARIDLRDYGAAYEKIVIAGEGEGNYANNREVMEDLKRYGSVLAGDGYLAIGHTHPVPEGSPIHPSCAAWTLPRTDYFRDLRNKRIAAMEGGKEYLAWRAEALRELSTFSYSERDRNEIAKKDRQFRDANLVENDGMLFYINPTPHGFQRDSILDDVNDFGDTNAFLGFKEWVPRLSDFVILGKAKKEAIGTPSSIDKFEVVVMRYNPKLQPFCFEKVDIED